MTSTETIFQCDGCLRFFDGDGAVLGISFGEASAAVREDRLVGRACGRADCAQIKANREMREKAICRKRIEDRGLRMAQQRSSARSSILHRPFSSPHPARSSCPPEREDGRPMSNVQSPTSSNGLAHAAEQRRFVAAGDGESDCERMLEILCGPRDDGFRMDDASRSTRGPWVANHVLIQRFGILTPHSRASQLRGADSFPPHPLVKRWRLDIDSSCDPALTGQSGWCYSVCFVEHSQRLAREKKSGEQQRNEGH